MRAPAADEPEKPAASDTATAQGLRQSCLTGRRWAATPRPQSLATACRRAHPRKNVAARAAPANNQADTTRANVDALAGAAVDLAEGGHTSRRRWYPRRCRTGGM
jgi:hypothetical protein